MTTATESAVLAANRAFYDAFARRRSDAMADLWARDQVVACIHPGWGVLFGREAVLASWRAILDSPEAPKVHCTDAAAVVLGDSAFVTCIEHIGDANVVATNVFILERGQWRLVHHHAGPMASGSESRRRASGALN